MQRKQQAIVTAMMVAAVSCVGVAPGVAAEDGAVGLEDMVVSANRYPAPAAAVGSTVRVMGAEEIARLNKSSVLELLRVMPGIEVIQGGGAGRTASIFIRGANSTHTLVLIDGLRMNPVAGGQYDFAYLTADNIERIEVLSGPQSTLYGSEAMGGVISITTKKGKPGEPYEVRAEGGSLGYHKGAVALRGGKDNADYSLSASYEGADGISAASEKRGNREEDGYNNVSTVNRVGMALGDDGRGDLVFRYSNAETELDGFSFGVGPTDALDYEQDTDRVMAGLTLRKPVTDWLAPSLRTGWTEEQIEGTDPETVYNNYEFKSRLFDVEAMADLIACESSVATVGYAYEQRRGENKGNYSETIDVHAVYLQERISWREILNGTAGLRYDDFGSFGNEVTYRGTLALRVPDTGVRFHGSYGTGFNAPTLNDLYFPQFGNPDLDAETSEGYDAGVEWTLGMAVLDVTYFQTDFDDLISFDDTTFTAANIAESEVRGVETTLGLALTDDLTVKTGYTYTDSEDKETGEVLPRRPTHRVTLYAGYRMLDKLTGSVSLVAVDDRIDSDGAKMDNYERVDAALEYAVSERWIPYLRIENLLDSDYEEVNGFTSPGFVGVVGVRGLM